MLRSSCAAVSNIFFFKEKLRFLLIVFTTVVSLSCLPKCYIELYTAVCNLSLKTEKWKSAGMIPELSVVTQTRKSDIHIRQIRRRKKKKPTITLWRGEKKKKIHWVKISRSCVKRFDTRHPWRIQRVGGQADPAHFCLQRQWVRILTDVSKQILM